MDAVEFMKERRRMCNASYDRELRCQYCKGSDENGDCQVFFTLGKPNGEWLKTFEQAVAIVEQWSKDHPRKTMLQDFYEKFPNAPKDSEDGTPDLCPYGCGYTKYDDCEESLWDCAKCWSRPVEE